MITLPMIAYLHLSAFLCGYDERFANLFGSTMEAASTDVRQSEESTIRFRRHAIRKGKSNKKSKTKPKWIPHSRPFRKAVHSRILRTSRVLLLPSDTVPHHIINERLAVAVVSSCPATVGGCNVIMTSVVTCACQEFGPGEVRTGARSPSVEF